MDEYTQSNRELWDEWTDIHARSAFYNLADFKTGRSTLRPIELEALGDVTGKSLLHLQCHFGLSTLDWARRGARVTGVDFSDKAITLARSLSAELDIPAEFMLSDIADLPSVLQGEFDLVFTTYGVVNWLADIHRWGQVIAHFLKPGGTFFLAEFHPFAYIFDDEASALRVRYPYSVGPDPLAFPVTGSYADRSARVSKALEYAWPHSLSDIFHALLSARLRIESFQEYPFCYFALLPHLMDGNEAREWRLREHGDAIPLMFSIKATKDLQD